MKVLEVSGLNHYTGSNGTTLAMYLECRKNRTVPANKEFIWKLWEDGETPETDILFAD